MQYTATRDPLRLFANEWWGSGSLSSIAKLICTILVQSVAWQGGGRGPTVHLFAIANHSITPVVTAGYYLPILAHIISRFVPNAIH